MKKNTEIDKKGINEIIHLSKNLLRVFYIVTIVSIILVSILACKQSGVIKVILSLLKVISPLFIGFIIAWLFYPLHKKLMEKKVPKVLSAIIIFASLILLVGLLLYFFVPVIYEQVNELISYVPNIVEHITGFFSNLFDKFDIKGLDITSIKDGIIKSSKELLLSITTAIPNGLFNLLKALASALGIIVMSLVVGIYMLIDFDNLVVNFNKMLPRKGHSDYVKLFQNIGTEARKVINGTLLVAFLVFVFDTIGFMIIGLNASVVFGLFCGITDLIPYIGPYIGGAAAVVVGFTQGPIIGIGTLVIAAVVQFLESYILQPVVMSKAMRLHPVTIIIGLLVFGHFFGVLGMIIATPCMAIIKEILLFIKRKRVVIKG